MRIELLGNPLVYKAPSFKRINGRVLTFDPRQAEKQALKQQICSQYMAAKNSSDSEISKEADRMLSMQFFDVACTFIFPPQKNCSQSDLNAKLWHFEKPTQRYDLDNLAKLYCDVIKGICIPDDAMIVTLNLKKHYGLIPKTIINITGKKIMDNEVIKILSVFSPDELHHFCCLANNITANKPCIDEQDTQKATDCSLFLLAISQYAKHLTKLEKIASKKVSGEGKTLC